MVSEDSRTNELGVALASSLLAVINKFSTIKDDEEASTFCWGFQVCTETRVQLLISMINANGATEDLLEALKVAIESSDFELYVSGEPEFLQTIVGRLYYMLEDAVASQKSHSSSKSLRAFNGA